MTDKLHQSLSSIMDGLGDDLELPRLLNVMQASSSQSQELSDKWRRYHLAQSVLRGELRGMKNPKTAHLDISAAVRQQLEDEQLADFTDSGAASELTFSSPSNKVSKNQTPAPLVAAQKRQERGQWLRGGAIAASVALLVITGTQIYNLSQEGEAPVNAYATQEATAPITRPMIQASQVASDCQSQLFSGGSVISIPLGNSQRKPCSGELENYSPLVSSPYSRQQSITPVSSR